MTPADCREASRPDHAGICLLTDLFGRDEIDQRAPLSVQGHHQFRESLSESRPFDEVDLECDDEIEVPWPEVNPPSRRKDSELARMLDLLDNLPRGKDSE